MKITLLIIIGIFLGFFVSKKLGNSRNALILKIFLIILLILFALWNEGVFG